VIGTNEFDYYLLRNEPCVLRGALPPDALPSRGGAEAAILDAYGPSTLVCGKELKNALLLIKGDAAEYLRDWHYARDAISLPSPGERRPLLREIPSVLASDHLNLFCDALAAATEGPVDDFRFAYVGRPGSRSLLHHDVLASHSWSINLSGQKLWLLLSPDDCALAQFYDAWGALKVSSLLADEDVDALVQRSSSGPPLQPADIAGLRLSAAALALLPPGARPLTYLQLPGDAVFVPSGWHHEVVNLGHEPIVLSVNANWFSGPALLRVLAFLERELAAIRERVAEPGPSGAYDAEFEAHCQKLMRLNSGLSLVDFARLLLFKADHCTAFAAEPDAGSAASLSPHEAPLRKPPAALLHADLAALAAALARVATDAHIKRLRPEDSALRECARGCWATEEELEAHARARTRIRELHARHRVPALRTAFTSEDLVAASVRCVEAASSLRGPGASVHQ